MDPKNVLNFWFEELTSKQWFEVDPKLDALIIKRYSHLLHSAEKGELISWRTNALGRLAEIIVLDQFSRNIYRGQPDAYKNDQMALTLAQEMVLFGMDDMLPNPMKPFAYMPYMHSESREVHNDAVKLFSKEGMEENYSFEIAHKKIIDQFGRYPHRNTILNRLSTTKELDFLKTNKGF